MEPVESPIRYLPFTSVLLPAAAGSAVSAAPCAAHRFPCLFILISSVDQEKTVPDDQGQDYNICHYLSLLSENSRMPFKTSGCSSYAFCTERFAYTFWFLYGSGRNRSTSSTIRNTNPTAVPNVNPPPSTKVPIWYTVRHTT